jgi:hypothetical protein
MLIIFTTITNKSRSARWWRAVDVTLLPFYGRRIHIHSGERPWRELSPPNSCRPKRRAQ